jgi:hypothetical protein
MSAQAHTFTITRDYLSLEDAQNDARARLSASPKTARIAAEKSILELWSAQNGVVTGNQVAAIATAAHGSATADGASFDEATQQYRACCDLCAPDDQQAGPVADAYGNFVKDGKLHNKYGSEICWTCHVLPHQHDWVSTPHRHPYSSAAED